MSDPYEEMSRDELLLRAGDWRGVANDRSTEIIRLEQQRAVIDKALRDAVAERDRLRAVVEDIIKHATPIAEDDDGFVAVGYTVTVGAVHRAIAAIQGAETTNG
jgi:hypothetical protein